jgi:hypothetical protein
MNRYQIALNISPEKAAQTSERVRPLTIVCNNVCVVPVLSDDGQSVEVPKHGNVMLPDGDLGDYTLLSEGLNMIPINAFVYIDIFENKNHRFSKFTKYRIDVLHWNLEKATVNRKTNVTIWKKHNAPGSDVRLLRNRRLWYDGQ